MCKYSFWIVNKHIAQLFLGSSLHFHSFCKQQSLVQMGLCYHYLSRPPNSDNRPPSNRELVGLTVLNRSLSAFHQLLSAFHHFFISPSSALHQLFISSSSALHQLFISVPSAFRQLFISSSSGFHQFFFSS